MADSASAARTVPASGTGAPVDLSVVIPILNERESLAALLDEVAQSCNRLTTRWEMVWVDDGSTDGSAELLANLAQYRKNVRFIQLRRHFGKSAALRAGIEQSRGDIVVTMDGDGQDDPAEIPALVEKLEEGFDVVSGWKQDRRDPPLKRWGSRVFNRLTARVSGVPLHDVNCGLKAYRGDAVRALEFYGEQHRLIPVLGFQRGWRITELPVHHRARHHGRSKFGTERYLRGLLDLFGVVLIGRYQYRPLHLFGAAGLVSMLVGFVLCIYLTIVKLSGHAIGTRPLLELGVLLVIAGIQLFTAGLLGEMITATRQDVRGRGATRQIIERTVEHADSAPSGRFRSRSANGS
jgi:glycosyltransferase involved in cell wall biosynthesis